MPDLRAVLIDAAELPDGRDLDPDPLLARAQRRRRRRHIAVAAPLVLVLFASAGIALRALAPDPATVRLADRGAPSPADAGQAPSASVLDLPPEGDVVPAFLDDGTEVFVVHRAGQVRVLDARRRGGDFPPSLMGWCPTSQAFEDHVLGSRFDGLGRYTGGPAPAGMVPYATDVQDGRILVGAPQPALPRSDNGDPPAGPSCFGDIEQGDEPVGHHLPPAPAASVEEALQVSAGTTVVVEGRVEIEAAGARVCGIAAGRALVRGEPNPVERRCAPDAAAISGIDPGVAPPGGLHAYEGRHVLTRTAGGFTDLVIAAGAAEAVGEVAAPAQGEDAVTAADRALVDVVHRFAQAPSADTFADLPLAAEGVRLGLARELRPARNPAELADPAAWRLEEPMFRGYVGPFSALELLARVPALDVSVGPHPHCASPPVPAPGEVADLRRVSVQPPEVASCLQWFTVDLFVGVDGSVEAVTLDLYEP